MIDNLELKQQFFASLNERQKRQFAALEANEPGQYGVTVISKLYSISPHTIHRSQTELQGANELTDGRIRRRFGGGFLNCCWASHHFAGAIAWIKILHYFSCERYYLPGDRRWRFSGGLLNNCWGTYQLSRLC